MPPTDCTSAPRLALRPMPYRRYNLPSQILQGNVILNLQAGTVRCRGYRQQVMRPGCGSRVWKTPEPVQFPPQPCSPPWLSQSGGALGGKGTRARAKPLPRAAEGPSVLGLTLWPFPFLRNVRVSQRKGMSTNPTVSVTTMLHFNTLEDSGGKP